MPLLLIGIPKDNPQLKTATLGSEFVGARIATDQIIGLRYTLMYLGVSVRSKSYMFGDNKSVVDSASIPTSTLSKKSTLASYHRVREAIGAGYLQFNWKDGKSNPTDILHKHWEFANIWPLLKPLLFWKGAHMSSLPRQRGVTELQPKRGGLSLTLMDQEQNNNPKCNPEQLPNKILGFSWQGSYYSTHNRTKYSDWPISQS